MKIEDYLKKQVLYQNKLEIIDFILKIKNEIEIKKEDDLNTIIFKKYIELENVIEVAEYVNGAGHRIKTTSWIGERKYLHKEITEILKSDVVVDERLKTAVRYIINNETAIKQFKI